MSNKYFSFLILLCILGCNNSGPVTTNTLSSKFANLPEKADFLEKYVQFKRTYIDLDYSIYYLNGGNGMIPGPSEWNIGIVAKVPKTEIADWIDSMQKTDNIPDTDWLSKIKTPIDYSNVKEWYAEGSKVVGVDKNNGIILYHIKAD